MDKALRGMKSAERELDKVRKHARTIVCSVVDGHSS